MNYKLLNKPLYILNLAVLLQQQRYIIPILYLFYIHNGLTLSDFLLFQSIFYFTVLLAQIPAGYIGDFFSRKYVLIFSYSLFIIRVLLWIFYPNYYTILLGEILYGLSKAFYRGVSDGYIYDYLKQNNLSDIMLNKYGKFNFFMSTGSAISCLIGAYLYQYIGFSLLLTIELLCNTTAICILFYLPQIRQNKEKIRFNEVIKELFIITKDTINDYRLNVYMLYCGILTGVTNIFVWSFQPIMKAAKVPIIIFGAIYFINHMLRAIGALNSQRFIEKFTLQKTCIIVWLLYIISFMSLLILTVKNSLHLCIAILIFICIAIGIQMIFNIGSLARIHHIIPSKSRATISSINSMLASLFSGVFLMIFKLLIDYQSLRIAIILFIMLFLFSLLLVKRICSLK